MKKILFVTRIFPPMAAVGVYRIIKFCKFLPEFGWEPIVLTTNIGLSYTHDSQLLGEVDPNMKVYRCPNPDPIGRWEGRKNKGSLKAAENSSPKSPIAPKVGSRSVSWRQKALESLSTPDTHVFWVPNAVFSGLKVIRKENVDVIITTSPPASTHWAGTILSYLTGKPHIVDFRDLWTQGPSARLVQRYGFAKTYDRWLEKIVLNKAAGICAATDHFVDQLLENNPNLDPVKLAPVLNGLDPDDFQDIQFPATKNPKFTILHMGSLYGFRDPSFFFDVLRKFVSDDPTRADKITARFIGNVGGFASQVRGTEIEKIVHFYGHRPHHTVLLELWGADLLLLILGFSDAEVGTFPAKLFEYIATNRPLLAFIPDGVARTMIEKHTQGHVFTRPNLEQACAALEAEYLAWELRHGARESSLHVPKEFHRRNQTEQLVKLLNMNMKE